MLPKIVSFEDKDDEEDNVENANASSYIGVGGGIVSSSNMVVATTRTSNAPPRFDIDVILEIPTSISSKEDFVSQMKEHMLQYPGNRLYFRLIKHNLPTFKLMVSRTNPRNATVQQLASLNRRKSYLIQSILRATMSTVMTTTTPTTVLESSSSTSDRVSSAVTTRQTRRRFYRSIKMKNEQDNVIGGGNDSSTIQTTPTTTTSTRLVVQGDDDVTCSRDDREKLTIIIDTNNNIEEEDDDEAYYEEMTYKEIFNFTWKLFHHMVSPPCSITKK